MPIEFQEYYPKRIVNIHKHVDGAWFWDKYTAHPYIGCSFGCQFCYSRGGVYAGNRNPDEYDSVIRVKTNAPILLKKELARFEPDIIACGDWQEPAERRFRLSRKMLEIILELRFPPLIIERSPTILRDLDLLVEIHKKTWAGVIFSMSSLDPRIKRAFEPKSPGIRLRLNAMEQIARAGITVGTALMPILPFAGDDPLSVEMCIKATKDHGGSFIIGGGLTMDGAQAIRTLSAYKELNPDLESRIRALYGWTQGGRSRGIPQGDGNRIGRLVKSLCEKHGLSDRMPRYVIPGPLALNKRIAERLFLRMYSLELDSAEPRRIWSYRKAAWTVDEHPESLDLLYSREGIAGLKRLPGFGDRLAGLVEKWIKIESQTFDAVDTASTRGDER